MKFLLCAILAASTLSAIAQVRVDGYTRKDGTYVQPHYRSNPNSTTIDNYSTKGNFNPYTGQQGTVDPYRQPSYQYQAPTYQNPSLNPSCGNTLSGQYVCN